MASPNTIETASLTIAVIVPMYNAASTIIDCLEPLLTMQAEGEIQELLVVDDGSTDASRELLADHRSVKALFLPRQSGPAAARNHGANNTECDYLWFVDADVVLANSAAQILREALTVNKGAVTTRALIGSYDSAPRATNFLSQYKNLVHRYYHQKGGEQSATFWSGCGVVERKTFEAINGFDAEQFKLPAGEDIELGYRLTDCGVTIRVLKNLEGKHLKEWRLRNLLHTEIFQRALPWSRMMLERRALSKGLNVAPAERARAVLAGITLCTILSCLAQVLSPIYLVATLALLIAGNIDFIRFFTQHKGISFAAGALLFHQFYYLYSTAAFGWATITHHLRAWQSAPQKTF